MDFTHAQILELTGMTQERLRHWRKEMSGLDSRASRSGKVTFEEVALLAVLSRATDELGLNLTVIAAHYEEMLTTFQENEAVGEPEIVLWLGVDFVTVSAISSPPEFEIAAVVRLAPIIERLYGTVHRSGGRQLALSLGSRG